MERYIYKNESSNAMAPTIHMKNKWLGNLLNKYFDRFITIEYGISREASIKLHRSEEGRYLSDPFSDNFAVIAYGETVTNPRWINMEFMKDNVVGTMLLDDSVPSVYVNLARCSIDSIEYSFDWSSSKDLTFIILEEFIVDKMHGETETFSMNKELTGDPIILQHNELLLATSSDDIAIILPKFHTGTHHNIPSSVSSLTIPTKITINCTEKEDLRII